MGWAKVEPRIGATSSRIMGPGRRQAPRTVAPASPGSTLGKLFDPVTPPSPWLAREAAMERLYACCAGLDVHARTVVACLRTPGERRVRHKEVRTFGTTTPELLALSDWLLSAGCTHVAMESTGVYWKPVFNILENVCEVLLVNAAHIKQVPGRKTDV